MGIETLHILSSLLSPVCMVLYVMLENNAANFCD